MVDSQEVSHGLRHRPHNRKLISKSGLAEANFIVHMLYKDI